MPKLYIYLLIWLHFPNSHSKGQKISKANYGILFIGKMMILGALFGCGDAVATVAAQASTGTEFFMTDMVMKYSVPVLAWVATVAMASPQPNSAPRIIILPKINLLSRFTNL